MSILFMLVALGAFYDGYPLEAAFIAVVAFIISELA